MPVVDDYTALLGGKYWSGIEVTGTPAIVTYSFPASAPSYLSTVEGFTPATIASFQAFDSTEQAQARQALAEWAAASGLVFIEVAPGQGDINFQLVDLDTTSGPSYAGAGGIGFYPFGDWNYFTYPNYQSDLDGSGDVFMNSLYETGSGVAYATLLHEIGHAIGLKHPTEIVTNYAANPVVVHDAVLSANDPARTIMAEGSAEGGTGHLQALDQQAAAFLYGPAGTGAVVTSSASGANAVVSSWSWNSAKQTLTQAGFAGGDTIRGSSVKDLVSGLDGNDRLFGLSGDDTLDGGAGDDLLAGGPGKDRMSGGAGDDVYLVDATGDRLIELAGGGWDTVYASVSHTLSAEIEVLQLFGAGLTGRGNDLGNSIFGDGSLGGRLYGMGGDDYVVGGSGKEVIDGGAGNDVMFGGAGDDRYVVDSTGDAVREDSAWGVDDGGHDQVKSTVSWTLGAFVEDLTLAGSMAIDGTGNDLANSIRGNGAANHLLGGGGDDILRGGRGADTLDGGEGSDDYYVDGSDIVRDTGTAGTDTVRLAAGSFSLTEGDGIENMTIASGNVGNLSMTGNALGNRITGNEGNNTLRGLAGDDMLFGGLGNDRLEGGAGRDQMTGGEGADTFVVNTGDSPATSSPLAYDTIADFVTGVDRIDLDTVGAGGLAPAAYAETVSASNGFSAVLAAASAAMSDGTKSAVFVAGPTDGWLFWNTDGNPQTPDQAVRLSGLNNGALFGAGDIV